MLGDDKMEKFYRTDYARKAALNDLNRLIVSLQLFGPDGLEDSDTNVLIGFLRDLRAAIEEEVIYDDFVIRRYDEI